MNTGDWIKYTTDLKLITDGYAKKQPFTQSTAEPASYEFHQPQTHPQFDYEIPSDLEKY